MRREVVKSVELNLLPLTRVKRGELSQLFSEYLSAANEILSTLKSERPTTETRLHHLTYQKIRERSRLPSQLVCAARLDAWTKRKHTITSFRHLPVSYNVLRSAALKQTRRSNPILSVASPKGRLGLPVARDGAWRRLSELLSEGWTFSELKLLDQHVVRVALRREFQVAEPPPGQGVMGVDVGVGTLAAITILSAGRVEQQLYLGRDVWQAKRDLGVRRSKLQAHASLGSRKARRVLRELKGYERRFNRTRCHQVAQQIVALAKRYNATIAMEDLRGLCSRKLSRRSNRKVKRMPYSILKQAIQSVAWQDGIGVSLVSPRYTSQTCSGCGARGMRKGAIFKCKKCGFTANADRNASVNIAKLLWERTQQDRAQPLGRDCVQFSQGGAAVNQPARCHDRWQDPARSHTCQHERKPPISIGGS